MDQTAERGAELRFTARWEGERCEMNSKISGDLPKILACMSYVMANFARDIHQKALAEMTSEQILGLLHEGAAAWLADIEREERRGH